MNNVKIYPYKMASESAKALANALGIKRCKAEGPPIKCDTFINWGSSSVKRDVVLTGPNYNYLNCDESVGFAANKLKTFKAFTKHPDRVSCPEWTESLLEANRWLDEGFTVVVRHKLTGHSGEGIQLVEPGEFEGVPEAPLYTKYIPKRNEYRIHVFQGEAFFIQRKARKNDVPDDQVNWKIRNHANGFIFAHKEIDVSDVAKTFAIRAVAALELDFGAVDIIEGTNRQWYVLEVNTACGLEGTTLEKYVEQFKRII